MANALSKLFGDIASAIKAKTGDNTNMKPAEFPNRIMNIVGQTPGVHLVTFMSEDGQKELFVRPVANEDDCADPVTRNYISKPTKEPDNYNTYTHDGWANSPGGSASDSVLSAVTANRTVYAAFKAETRYYTVNFYDGDTIVDSVRVPYGGTATPTYNKPDHKLVGWTPSNENITGDTDCYGTWVYAAYVEAEIADTWDEIIAAVADGSYKTKYTIGNYKTLNTTLGAVPMQLVAKDTDELSDGSGKAATTWIPMSAQQNGYSTYTYYMNSNASKTGGWPECDARGRWNTTDYFYTNTGQANIRSAVKQVKKTSLCYDANGNAVQITTDDYVWLPSVREIFCNDDFETEGVMYNAGAFETQARRNRKKYNSYTYTYWWTRTQPGANRFHAVANGGLNTSQNGYAQNAQSYAFLMSFCI